MVRRRDATRDGDAKRGGATRYGDARRETGWSSAMPNGGREAGGEDPIRDGEVFAEPGSSRRGGGVSCGTVGPIWNGGVLAGLRSPPRNGGNWWGAVRSATGRWDSMGTVGSDARWGGGPRRRGAVQCGVVGSGPGWCGPTRGGEGGYHDVGSDLGCRGERLPHGDVRWGSISFGRSSANVSGVMAPSAGGVERGRRRAGGGGVAYANHPATALPSFVITPPCRVITNNPQAGRLGVVSANGIGRRGRAG